MPIRRVHYVGLGEVNQSRGPSARARQAWGLSAATRQARGPSAAARQTRGPKNGIFQKFLGAPKIFLGVYGLPGLPMLHR